jgi:hypothetical protein
VVERQLPKLNVAGSNPVSRSKEKIPKSLMVTGFSGFLFYFFITEKHAKKTLKIAKMQVRMRIRTNVQVTANFLPVLCQGVFRKK